MKQNLLNRFLNYVQISTYSNENSESTPSTKEQFDLAHFLADEMEKMGVSGVYCDENCYVYGYIPASPGYEELPALGFIAHMDTSSSFGTNPVKPLIHYNYDGSDIYLEAGDCTISVKDFSHLKQMTGRTIITSDGTSILGADDKAGIAEIMTMAEEILCSSDQSQERSHGKICICFTPDEEIGSGADLLDLQRFGAKTAYTLDGDLEGTIEYENFNAASGTVRIKGVSVHPGSAAGIMINAAAVAAEFQNLLPGDEQPRFTVGYQGFFHLTAISGSVDEAVMHYIIRDHDRASFEARKQLFHKNAEKLNKFYEADVVTVTTKDSYYNMAEIIKNHMELINNVRTAIQRVGLIPQITPVRGGTDGARLSFRGLPCPNLGTGGYAFHGPLEHISLEGMELTVKILLELVCTLNE